MRLSTLDAENMNREIMGAGASFLSAIGGALGAILSSFGTIYGSSLFDKKPDDFVIDNEVFDSYLSKKDKGNILIGVNIKYVPKNGFSNFQQGRLISLIQENIAIKARLDKMEYHQAKQYKELFKVKDALEALDSSSKSTVSETKLFGDAGISAFKALSNQDQEEVLSVIRTLFEKDENISDQFFIELCNNRKKRNQYLAALNYTHENSEESLTSKKLDESDYQGIIDGFNFIKELGAFLGNKKFVRLVR